MEDIVLESRIYNKEIAMSSYLPLLSKLIILSILNRKPIFLQSKLE